MVSSDEINKRLRARGEGKSYEKEIKGYLICDRCNGYYELQNDESPDDFINVCNCGGKLVYSKNLQKIKHDNDHKMVVTCPYCQTKNPKYSQYCMECGVKLSDAKLKREIKDLLLDLSSEDQDIQFEASMKLVNYLSPNSYLLNDPVNVKEMVLNFGIDPIVYALNNGNNIIKVDMAWCLGYLNDEITIKPLIESLDDDEVSGACIVNLVSLKEFSLKPLIDILGSKNEKLINAAATALGQIKDEKAVEPLLEVFLSSPEISYSISNALSEIKSPKAVKPLIESLKTENIKLKRQIALILGNIGDKSAIEPLIRSLNDKDAYFRRQAVIALGKIGDERVVEPLIRSLEDKTAVVRGEAARYLGELNVKRSLVYLKPLLNDKNENVKKTAKIAINKIENIRKERLVPEWNEYYPSLDSATNEQKEFYEKWLNEFKRGNYIDIEGNLSYVFVFLYEVINQFIENKDIVLFLENFRKIELGYSNYEKFKSYLSFWRICAYLYTDRRDKIWDEVKSSDMNLDTALTCAVFLPEFDESFFDGHKMIQMMNYLGLTKFGKENKEKIGEVVTIILEDFKREKGKHILKYFIENFNLKNLTETDFKTLKIFFPKKEKFMECKRIYEEKEKGNDEDIYYGGLILRNYEFQGFSGVPIFSYPENNPKFEKVLYRTYIDEKVYVPLIVMEAFKNEMKRIFRESEDIYREEKDIPKIGEGWVSETELYYKIKDAFPNEQIIHHGRPKWLGRQYLDIYFPKHNIAIEYQGDQHDSPIEYFGGEKGFKHRKELDVKKKEKCRLNNCYLIYVYPNYNFKEIEQEIKYSFLKNEPKSA